jgi:hypothetical protein
LAVALANKTQSNRPTDDLLNFQFARDSIYIVYIISKAKCLSPTAGRQRRRRRQKKNCQLTQLDGSIGRINGSAAAEKKATKKSAASSARKEISISSDVCESFM